MHFITQTFFVFIFFVIIRLNYVLIIIIIWIFVVFLFFFRNDLTFFFILIKNLIFLKNILQNNRIFFYDVFFFITVFIKTRYCLIIEKKFMNFSTTILFCTQVSQNKNDYDLFVLKKFWTNNFSNFKKKLFFYDNDVFQILSIRNLWFFFFLLRRFSIVEIFHVIANWFFNRIAYNESITVAIFFELMI